MTSVDASADVIFRKRTSAEATADGVIRHAYWLIHIIKYTGGVLEAYLHEKIAGIFSVINIIHQCL